jgi:hypothetical protein
MELMAADFMTDCVEETLRTFLRVIRTERMSKLSEIIPVSTPAECAAFWVHLFLILSNDLSDDVSRRTDDDHYCARRNRDMIAVLKTPPSGKLEDKAVEKKSPTKPCAGHLGKQLKAAVQLQIRVVVHLSAREECSKINQGTLGCHSLMLVGNQEDLKSAAKASS